MAWFYISIRKQSSRSFCAILNLTSHWITCIPDKSAQNKTSVDCTSVVDDENLSQTVDFLLFRKTLIYANVRWEKTCTTVSYCFATQPKRIQRTDVFLPTVLNAMNLIGIRRDVEKLPSFAYAFIGEVLYTHGLKSSTITNAIEIQIFETRVLFLHKYLMAFSCLNVEYTKYFRIKMHKIITIFEPMTLIRVAVFASFPVVSTRFRPYVNHTFDSVIQIAQTSRLIYRCLSPLPLILPALFTLSTHGWHVGCSRCAYRSIHIRPCISSIINLP